MLVGGHPEDAGPPLRDLGVTLFTVGAGGPDYDLTAAEALCKWRASR